MENQVIEKEIEVNNLSFYYGDKLAVKNVTLDIEKNKNNSINRSVRLR